MISNKQNNHTNQVRLRKYIFILFYFSSMLSMAQTQELEIREIKDPIIDTNLNIGFSVSPLYIINDNYVIFQEDKTTRKFINPDINTFRIEKNGRGLFASDKNGVYYKGKFIKTPPEGFTRLNECAENNCIWKTNEKVFHDTVDITKDIDVSSFQYLAYNYFTDKNFIYFNGKKIEKSDGASASRTLVYGGIYDENYVYSNGNIATYKGDTVRSVNAVLGKTKQYVFKHPSLLDIQEEIDFESIKALSQKYSIDKNSVYFWNLQLPIPPENFKNIKVWEQKSSCYISDGKNIYSGNRLVELAIDTETFGMIPFTDYIFDKKGIYHKEWNHEKQTYETIKFPFDYTEKITSKNTFIGNHYRYIIYENQVYDFLTRKLFKNLSKDDINLVRSNYKTIDQINGEIIEIPRITDSLKLISSSEQNMKIYKGKEKLYELNGNRLIQLTGVDPQTITVNKQNFLADKEYIYSNHYRIIRNNGLELIAVFKISIIPNHSDDKKYKDIVTFFENQYLFKNNEGYWLVNIYTKRLTNNEEVRIKSLGKELDENIKEMLLRK